MHERLEIKQKSSGSIDILLDGTPMEGVIDAVLELGVKDLPKLTVTLLVRDVSVYLGKVECETYEKE